ncbi:hypothetical protein FJZ33_01185 [Candidatus Poribacteria bacterium]|nr:hypothetical protein [Candidatus Poribacteria bacterium]
MLVRLILTLLVLFVFVSFAGARTLFFDDFEGKAKGNWVFTDVEGKGTWEVTKFDGKGVLKAASINAWTGATVDGVASLKNHNEIWASCMFLCEQDITSCNELGLLTDPKTIPGNWYLSTCEGGNEIGIDEANIAWHGRIPFKWELGKWYRMKIMVSKDTIYGKMWLDKDKEPDKWLTQAKMTTHLEEDGVGLISYHCITYFDDVIVATDEKSLVAMAVSSGNKLAVAWGSIKF